MTAEQWLGDWDPAVSACGKDGGEGNGVLWGAGGLGAPAGGFRRGASNLWAALKVALACEDCR